MMQRFFFIQSRRNGWNRSFSSQKNSEIHLPNYLRLREFAKLVQEKNTARICQRLNIRKHYKKFDLTHEQQKLSFPNQKSIVLPYSMTSQYVLKHLHNKTPLHVDYEPSLNKQQVHNVQARNPVIAVMGHVDHGKTSLIDTLRGTNLADREVQGITQKLNICEAALNEHNSKATFLDTPGHFHFFRMRANAANVADLVLLIVAIDEGCRLQTDESVGCIEESGIPAIVCVNKFDLLHKDEQEERFQQTCNEIRSFAALENATIIPISGKTGWNLDAMKKTILDVLEEHKGENSLTASFDRDGQGVGIVLESYELKGHGDALRVLVKNGVIRKNEHFVCGFIHGKIRGFYDTEGKNVSEAVPGTVVDIVYKKEGILNDAPLEFDFHVVQPLLAKKIIEQRELAVDFKSCLVEEPDLDVPDRGFYGSPMMLKVDSAGSLTSVLDTIDDMDGVHVAGSGIGNVTKTDINLARDGSCPIYCFNVKVLSEIRALALSRGVIIKQFETIHEMIEDIQLMGDASE